MPFLKLFYITPKLTLKTLKKPLQGKYAPNFSKPFFLALLNRSLQKNRFFLFPTKDYFTS
jgi:hypothetical protein